MQLDHPEGGGKLLVGTLESTYWGWDKMATLSQMTSANPFPCMTILLWFKFNLKLFASAKLIIIYHWLRVRAWSQTGNPNQWWPSSIVQIGMAQPRWVDILTQRQIVHVLWMILSSAFCWIEIYLNQISLECTPVGDGPVEYKEALVWWNGLVPSRKNPPPEETLLKDPWWYC